MAKVMWRDCDERDVLKEKVNLHATLSVGAAVRLTKSLHSAFALTISCNRLSLTFDGKGLRVAEYMLLDAIFCF